MANSKIDDPKTFINSFAEELRPELALAIFLFAMTQLDCRSKSAQAFWDECSVHNTECLASEHWKKLTSKPFELSEIMLVAIRNDPYKWSAESMSIWSDYT